MESAKRSLLVLMLTIAADGDGCSVLQQLCRLMLLLMVMINCAVMMYCLQVLPWAVQLTLTSPA